MKISIILNGDSQVETQNLASPVLTMPTSARNNVLNQQMHIPLVRRKILRLYF